MTGRREFVRALLAVLRGAIPGSAQGDPVVPRLQAVPGRGADLIWTAWELDVPMVEWRAGIEEWRAAKVGMEEMTAADSGLDASLFIGRAELDALPVDSLIEYRMAG